MMLQKGPACKMEEDSSLNLQRQLLTLTLKYLVAVLVGTYMT